MRAEVVACAGDDRGDAVAGEIGQNHEVGAGLAGGIGAARA